MQSDGSIDIDNNKGNFYILGQNSKLNTSDLNISGQSIEGTYEIINDVREITNLTVQDDKIANIENNKFNMFSNKAIYSKENNLIELFNNVKIIRNTEVVTGDYAEINTIDESYKISSQNSNKVKLLIETSNE